MELLDAAQSVLAQNYFGNTRTSSLAGPIGGLLIGLLAVTTVLLIRNMNARIRRLPAQFPDRTGEAVEVTGSGSPDRSPEATTTDRGGDSNVQ